LSCWFFILSWREAAPPRDSHCTDPPIRPQESIPCIITVKTNPLLQHGSCKHCLPIHQGSAHQPCWRYAGEWNFDLGHMPMMPFRQSAGLDRLVRIISGFMTPSETLSSHRNSGQAVRLVSQGPGFKPDLSLCAFFPRRWRLE
jgi:hypothetical protein